MTTTSNISGYLSTAEASHVLGSTSHHVARLARDGEIASLRTAGDALLVDASSLYVYKQISRGKGRPFSNRMAFAALWELSGLEAPWLSYAQRRRLRIKLADTTAEDLVWVTRKRAVERRYRASASFLPRIKERMILSGRTRETSGALGLVASDDVVEGYARLDDLADLARSFFLEDDPRGNVVVHAEDWLPDVEGSTMPEAVVAVDLAASLDTRGRSAGLAKLKELIDGYANGSDS
ncbi:hypothetical protein [Arabiibacter massiliensis]|uniref:hypothetical protein n=1 Tax=Arabiibacter massiliensis TaxID=1870985 RepID=UPI00117A8281|nr:hypothetical protein [Arabiibacter massiliensis]